MLYTQSVQSNVTAVMAWLSSLGLNKAEVSQLLGRCPMLSKIPRENAVLVAGYIWVEHPNDDCNSHKIPQSVWFES